MGTQRKLASLLVFSFVIGTTTQMFPMQPSSHEFYVTEIVRVKRQAGYVYNKPSIPFNLPTRPSNTPTQKSNVDRTQEQHMYYAYPVPSSGDTANSGYSSDNSGSVGISNTGYNYEKQSNEEVTQTTNTPANPRFNSGVASPSQITSGYNYNSPSGSISSSQTSTKTSSSTATSSVSVGYGYGAPSSSNTGQTDFSSSSQSVGNGANPGNNAQGGGSSGYGYNAPSTTSSLTSSQSDSEYTITERNTFNNDNGYEASISSSGAGQTNTNSIDTLNESLKSVSQSSPVASNTGKVQSGYEYEGPSGDRQSSKSSISSTATSSVSTAYNYDPPIDSNQESISTSTSAPQYLPPIGGGNSGIVGVSNGYGLSNSDKNDIDSKAIIGYDGGNGSGGINVANGISENNGRGDSNMLSNTGGYVSAGAADRYTSVDNGSGSRIGYNGGQNAEARSNIGFSRLSNNYIPPSLASNSFASPPSLSYVPVEKEFSSPSLGSGTSAPKSKPTSSYLPASGISNVPTSLSSSPKLIRPLPQSNTVPSNSHTGPSGPSQTYIPSTKLSSINKPAQTYTSSALDATRPAVRPPSSKYLPQDVGTTGSVVGTPSQSYVPQSTRSTAPVRPPSQTYIPQTFETTQPALGAPSLNYIPQSLGPSGLTQPSTSSLSNKNYLLPNKSGEQSVPLSSLGALQPTANYLPPSSNSVPRAQSPQVTYLPPIL